MARVIQISIDVLVEDNTIENCDKLYEDLMSHIKNHPLTLGYDVAYDLTDIYVQNGYFTGGEINKDRYEGDNDVNKNRI